MIDTVGTGVYETEKTTQIQPETKKVLHWKKNERMGGMVPVWKEVTNTPKTSVETKLSDAAQGKNEENFDSALAYADIETASGATPYSEAEEFGFGDLIDMVNPLHHLPIVGHIYREITGDEIKPISKIMGGGVFGGPAGLAGGLVNAVVEYETGQDLTGNVISFVTEGETPEYRSAPASENPEKRLNETVKNLEENPYNLPGSVIGFADLGHGKREVYERVPAASGRMAGTQVQKRVEIAAPNPVREPITQLMLSPMPLLSRDGEKLY